MNTAVLDVSAANDSFGTWAERWLKLKQGEVSTNWHASYKSYVDLLNCYIEYMPITKIRTADVQNAISDLAACNPNTGKPASKKTLMNISSTVNQIFELAIANRVLDYNPSNALRLPKTQETPKRRALTDVEQMWIINTEHRAKRAA